MKRLPRLRTQIVSIISSIILVASVHAETCPVENPNIESGVLKVRPLVGLNRDPRNYIQWKVAQLALEKSGIPYDFDVSSHIRAPDRGPNQLRELGSEANLIWGSIGRQKEVDYLPVRVPIFRGLSSYWYVWVREEDFDKFSDVKTFADMRKFPILQGTNWSTIPLLEAKGLVVRSGAFLNLTKMLARGRADALFFAAIDSQKLLDLDARELGLVPLPDVLVYHPLDQYIYVDKCSKDLHDALFAGLEAAVKDGSHEELLREYAESSDIYERVSDGGYSLLELGNPDLTAESLKTMDKYQLEFK